MDRFTVITRTCFPHFVGMMPIPQDIGFYLFRLLLPSIVVAMQYMLFRKSGRWLAERFPGRPGLRYALAVPFILFNAVLVILLVIRPVVPEMHGWFKYLAAYPFFIWHGATLFIALIIILSTVIALPVRLSLMAARAFSRLRTAKPGGGTTATVSSTGTSRREFLRKSMYGLTAVSFAGSAYGVVLGRTRCEINRTDIHIPHLPPGMEGFTIGLISDIHSSAFMLKDEMQQYVAAMNGLGTDMIAVTGDFVNSRLVEAHPFAEAFSALHAPSGVYGVLGNHDFFTREVDAVARIIDDCGIRLLRNDAVTIQKNGAMLLLAGVDDVGLTEEATDAMQAALRGTTGGIPRVLLCHRPYFLPQAAAQGFDLMLSGHTHGGQVSLGSLGGATIAPAALVSRYVWGNYSERSTSMYVSRGVGTVGLPIRINCPPELTVLRLTRGVPMAAYRDRVLTIS
jgi:predicted MPP superfamily phosphohydrolase